MSAKHTLWYGPLELLNWKTGQEIDRVTEKFLGIMFDESLSWKPHIYYVRNKLNKAAGILKKFRSYVNTDAMVNLYYFFAYPGFMYCIHVWGNNIRFKLRISEYYAKEYC